MILEALSFLAVAVGIWMSTVAFYNVIITLRSMEG